jgi:chromosome segregation ATPase
LCNAQLDSKTAELSRLTHANEILLHEKNSIFDQLEVRQAESESLRSMQDTLQSRISELQYQLRESSDRVALLTEELAEARMDAEVRLAGPSNSKEDVARLISSIEARYEAKLAELQRNLVTVERDRSDSEAEWSRKLRDKSREMDALVQSMGTTIEHKQQEHDIIVRLNGDIQRLTQEAQQYKQEILKLQAQLRDTTAATVCHIISMNHRK